MVLGLAVMVILLQVHQMSPGSVYVPCLDSMGEQYMILHGKMHGVNFKSYPIKPTVLYLICEFLRPQYYQHDQHC